MKYIVAILALLLGFSVGNQYLLEQRIRILEEKADLDNQWLCIHRERLDLGDKQRDILFKMITTEKR
jgi:hypothetical protein